MKMRKIGVDHNIIAAWAYGLGSVHGKADGGWGQ